MRGWVCQRVTRTRRDVMQHGPHRAGRLHGRAHGLALEMKEQVAFHGANPQRVIREWGWVALGVDVVVV